ncbi:MAG: DNA gyrase subunit A [Patescibacteria group bacterium]|nr:DNA gyrase subunit A [Patescibacteria group bacterium]
MAKKEDQTKTKNKVAEKIQPSSIINEMERSYLDYALSVIVSRALPDVRDGLKPVQRRIIYAMHDQGIGPSSRYQKSAAVVGEVLKKYHPHGDTSVYDALVRMAQEFSLRYPLVDGQGNFGSLDGDSAAAMRYTEARLASISEELLRDIDKETVPFIDNYSGSTKEPEVLPSLLPNILLNGASGIAVGMATNIPPHNLNEVVDALCHMIDTIKIDKKEIGYTYKTFDGKESEIGQDFEIDSDVTVEKLMEFIKGPDFPTGGEIYDKEEIIKAYATGKGRIVNRARAEIEDISNGKHAIIFTEIPYQQNKARLVAKIAGLVRDEVIEDITDLRDESDREGLRIVVETRRNSRPQKVLNQLYKNTRLQTAFHANMVGLIRGEPKTLTLKMILQELLRWRKDVFTRKTIYLLRKARAREHILLGLKIAFDHLDEVIETIRNSESADVAKQNLVENFELTEMQAQAILNMRLRRLAKLEREKIENELEEILRQIDKHETFLKEPVKVMKQAKKDFQKLKEDYGDTRRTTVHPGKPGEFADEDLTQEEDILITLTKGGYVKRVKPQIFKSQKRGGKGVIGMKTKEDDYVINLKSASTLDTIFFFTARGNVHQVRGFQLPEMGRTARGKAIVNVLDLSPEDEVVAIVPLTKGSNAKYLTFATKNGLVKRTELSEFENIRRGGIIAINIKDGDRLANVEATSGKDEIILITEQGQSIRFQEKEARSMGRNTSGVKGITLNKGDQVFCMNVVKPGKQREEGLLLTISNKGYGKKTPLSEYPLQGRGGKGVIAMRVKEKTGKITESKILVPEVEDLFLISEEGHVIRLNPNEISKLSRATQGVRVMRLSKNDQVAALASPQ